MAIFAQYAVILTLIVYFLGNVGNLIWCMNQPLGVVYDLGYCANPDLELIFCKG